MKHLMGIVLRGLHWGGVQLGWTDLVAFKIFQGLELYVLIIFS